jgi:LPS O-antigen subunit length determinant protein (WzzB/FepE family)
MEYMAILEQIFEIIIIPLVGALVAYAISFIKAKTNELKEKTDNEIE